MIVLDPVETDFDQMFKYLNQTIVVVSPKNEHRIKELEKRLREEKIIFKLSNPYPELQNGRQFRILSHEVGIKKIQIVVDEMPNC